MTKHLPENEKWSIFLNAATNSTSIDVKSVIGQEISFTTNDLSVLSALNDQKTLKSKIIHAIPSKALEISPTANDYSKQLAEVLNYSGNQIITSLIDSNFLENHSINMDSKKCHDNIFTKIITCKLEKEGTKTILFKQEQVNFGYLQSMLRDPKELAEILIENKPILTEESFTGEDSSFGQDVLRVIELDKNHAEVKFNYGLIKHSVQSQYDFGAPVIYSTSFAEKEFIIDKNNLLSYMHQTFPSGVIFTEGSDNKLQPIMFQKFSENSNISNIKTTFDISLDRSGSMANVFPEYKEKIGKIITQITDSTKNWEISITAFDHKKVTKKFSSVDNDSQDITKFISNPSEGTTHLYDTMYERISHISKLNAGENAVILVFTDGENNGGAYTNTDVTKLAYNLREANPQFAMYTMGYGDHYTASFFNDMVSNAGFTHLHLGKLDQIAEFNQYVSTINNCKVIYSFENGAAKFFEQCAAGDIAISSNLVSYDSILKIAGDSYNIGFEAN